MIFSDPVFLLLFLPFTVAVHRLALRVSEAAAQWVLIAASLMFYAAWDVRWVPLLIGSIVVNLWLGRKLIEKASRSLLIAGIGLNLVPLFLVKYLGWVSGGYLLSDIALPLGISFYTFQQIAFLVDAHQHKMTEVGTRHYVLFVGFFSQLIAGPICHHREMIQQFRQRFSLSSKDLSLALFLIVMGLVKKAVVADRLGPYADSLFDGGGVVSIYEAWIGSLAYTFQLLFDFAGYCEMAMGLALLFGYKIPINFLSPYKSRSITEFWRTWHITLGRFFRDYVYIPMGGNRLGAARMYLALFATAFLSGIWHGAGATFLIWGVLHGLALVVEKWGSRVGIQLRDPIRLVLTFLFVSLAWVMFRSPDVSTAINVYQSLLGVNGASLPPLFANILGREAVYSGQLTGLEVFAVGALLWWVWTKPNVHERQIIPGWRALGAGVGAAAAVLLSITNPTTFLYFQF